MGTWESRRRVPLLSMRCSRALAYNRPSARTPRCPRRAGRLPLLPARCPSGSDATFTPPARHASPDRARRLPPDAVEERRRPHDRDSPPGRPGSALDALRLARVASPTSSATARSPPFPASTARSCCSPAPACGSTDAHGSVDARRCRTSRTHSAGDAADRLPAGRRAGARLQPDAPARARRAATSPSSATGPPRVRRRSASPVLRPRPARVECLLPGHAPFALAAGHGAVAGRGRARRRRCRVQSARRRCRRAGRDDRRRRRASR